MGKAAPPPPPPLAPALLTEGSMTGWSSRRVRRASRRVVGSYVLGWVQPFSSRECTPGKVGHFSWSWDIQENG